MLPWCFIRANERKFFFFFFFTGIEVLLSHICCSAGISFMQLRIYGHLYVLNLRVTSRKGQNLSIIKTSFSFTATSFYCHESDTFQFFFFFFEV